MVGEHPHGGQAAEGVDRPALLLGGTPRAPLALAEQAQQNKILYISGAAAVDGSGEEGHSERLVVGDALECTDQVRSFKVLRHVSKLDHSS